MIFHGITLATTHRNARTRTSFDECLDPPPSSATSEAMCEEDGAVGESFGDGTGEAGQGGR